MGGIQVVGGKIKGRTAQVEFQYTGDYVRLLMSLEVQGGFTAHSNVNLHDPQFTLCDYFVTRQTKAEIERRRRIKAGLCIRCGSKLSVLERFTGKVEHKYSC